MNDIKLAFHYTDILVDILARIVARYRRVVQLATGITSIARVGRVGEDPREDVCVGVDVGVVEFQLKRTLSNVTHVGLYM